MEPLLHDTRGTASVATAVALIIASYSMWWRWSEAARARNFVRGSGGDGTRLPSPMAALPRWCGFFGGHILLMKPRKTVQQLEGWAEEFGGDYELHLLGKRVVCVTGIADIRRILTLRPSKFKRGLMKDLNQGAASCVGMNGSMFFLEGKEWGRSRRLVSPNLSGHNVAGLLALVAKIGERFCDRLGEMADKGEAVPAMDTFARFTHDVIAMAAFGVDVGSVTITAENPCQSYDAIWALTAAFGRLTREPLDMLGWKLWPMLLPWVKHTKEHARSLEKVIQGAIEKVRRENGESGLADKEQANDAGGHLLRKIVGPSNGNQSSSSSSSERNKRLSDREIISEATTLFVAGTETTTPSLCWAMYYLDKHPEVVARCRAEALRVAPLSNGMVSTREQMSQLEYCSAVFKETLRLQTPAPLVPLYCTEDFTFENGFVVKGGSGLFVMTRTAARSEEFFTKGKDFVPERWIAAEREEALLGKGGAVDGNGASVVHEAEAAMSFGHGPRICPGQDMANAEGAMIIAAICARFDFSIAPGQADPPEEIEAFAVGLEEFNMVFTRRYAA